MKTIAPYASVTYHFPWEPAFLLVVGGHEGVTDEERLLKTGRKRPGARARALRGLSDSSKLPHLPGAGVPGQSVDGVGNGSGRSGVSLNPGS